MVAIRNSRLNILQVEINMRVEIVVLNMIFSRILMCMLRRIYYMI